MNPWSGANAAIRANASRARSSAMSQRKADRPRLGDLLDLVEIARGAGPVANAAAEGGAGQVAAGDMIQMAGGAQAVDDSPSCASAVACVIPCRSCRPHQGCVVKCQSEMGAAQGQRVKGYTEKQLRGLTQARVRLARSRTVAHSP